MSTKRRRSGIFGILDAARDYRAGGPGPKATLMVLLEHMGEVDGEWICFPSMATLAHDSEQAEATVRRHLRDFEQAGLLVRRPRGKTGGGRATNLIVLNRDLLEGKQTDHDERFGQGQTAHLGGANRSSGGGQTTHLAEVAPLIGRAIEEPEEESARTTDSSLRFEKFWSAYPARQGKKLNKGPTRERFEKLTYDEQRAAWIGAKNLAVSIAAGGTFGPPDPDRWLRDRRWEDWQEPAEVTPNGKSEPQSWSMAYTQ